MGLSEKVLKTVRTVTPTQVKHKQVCYTSSQTTPVHKQPDRTPLINTAQEKPNQTSLDWATGPSGKHGKTSLASLFKDHSNEVR